jgi:hypothetical protein
VVLQARMASTTALCAELDLVLETLSERRMAAAPESNPFRILRVQSDEIRQSAWLAWLMQPAAEHRIGAEIVRSIADTATAAGQSSITVGNTYSVRTEYPAWKAQIDIVVSSPGPSGFVIYVENKVWAGLGVQQLATEAYDLRRVSNSLAVPEGQTQRIVIAPNPDILGLTPDWAVISYSSIRDLVRALMPRVVEPWRSWIIAWLEALPDGSSPAPVATQDAETGRAFALLTELTDLIGTEVQLSDVTCKHLHLTNRAPWQSGLEFGWASAEMKGVQIGVERLRPENIVNDQLGAQPRLWVWHPHSGSDGAKRVRDALIGLQGDDLNPDLRRRGYLEQQTVPAYLPGQRGYSETVLYQKILDFYRTWSEVLQRIDTQFSSELSAPAPI